ncbi:MAG: cytochrome c3 family protein [Armatimonadota bacterium]|jgi:hypothetical protein|nr:MAG: class III cytochrome C domain protein [Anaerolineae bacterium]
MLKRLGAWAVYAYFALFLAIIVALGSYWNYLYATPEQPIAFPHKTHVQVVNLKCENCHLYTDKGRQAGIPSVQKCMECHQAVKTESPEIQKLTKYWEENREIEWAQIHKVPEYVYFSHKRHVTKGIPCETCHGQIGYEMVVHKAKSLSMGFCVTCHRQNNAPVDCYTCHK